MDVQGRFREADPRHVSLVGRSVLNRELMPGSLFVHRVGDEAALGLRLSRNQFGLAALAFTHAPAEGQLPGLVTDQFLESDATVFEYEEPSISPHQEFSNMHGGEWPLGAFVSTTAGNYLSCVRQATAYRVNWTTGEIDTVGHLRAFWTPQWSI